MYENLFIRKEIVEACYNISYVTTIGKKYFKGAEKDRLKNLVVDYELKGSHTTSVSMLLVWCVSKTKTLKYISDLRDILDEIKNSNTLARHFNKIEDKDELIGLVFSFAIIWHLLKKSDFPNWELSIYSEDVSAILANK